MRAVRYYGYKDIRIEDVPEPQCTAGTVKVRPRYNGLCGSDLHCYFDKDFPHVGFTHPLTNEKPPLTFGHEFSGEVTEIGDGVTTLQVGDKVAVYPVFYDRSCDGCTQGAPNCCQQIGFLGLHGGGGGLSDAVVVKEDMAFKLPANFDMELGALVEPLAVGWHGVGLLKPLAADAVALVLGGGPVGCAVILALASRGLKHILVSEPSEARAAVCREIGATTIFDPLAVDIEKKVREYTNGRGVEAVIDCAGVPATYEMAIKVVRSRGQVVVLSIFSGPLSFNPSGALMYKEASLHSSMAYNPEDYRAVIQALEKGGLNAKAMITKRIPLDKLVEEGLEPLHDPKITHCKILVDLQM